MCQLVTLAGRSVAERSNVPVSGRCREKRCVSWWQLPGEALLGSRNIYLSPSLLWLNTTILIYIWHTHVLDDVIITRYKMIHFIFGLQQANPRSDKFFFHSHVAKKKSSTLARGSRWIGHVRLFVGPECVQCLTAEDSSTDLLPSLQIFVTRIFLH